MIHRRVDRAAKFVFLTIITVLGWCSISSSEAEPYLPASDGQILERLPFSNQEPLQRRIRALRNALDQHPHDPELSFALARIYIKLGKSQADPRFFGYAEGLLNPWWNLPEPPSEMLLLRASILQNRHDFDNALGDLEKLVGRDALHSQAWLARASIFLARAEFEDAQLSCLPLLEMDDPLIAATCLSQVASLTGHAAESYDLLREALANTPSPRDEARVYSLTVLATIAAQVGQNQDADRIFRQALALQAEDPYLLGIYSDFLLDENRETEVLSLLKDKTRIDSLLLRLALAKQRLGAADLEGIVRDLKGRFAESRLRGENLHPGDEARYLLFLLKQPERALALAQANWENQREPKDIRILLEAALAARNPAAARPALDLLTRTGLEHPVILRLAAKLRTRNEN